MATLTRWAVGMKRPRDYLTETEIERLMEAARKNRQGHRDATAMLLAYRHGLRAVGRSRPQPRPPACAPRQGRGNHRPSNRRQGDQGAAAAPARLNNPWC